MRTLSYIAALAILIVSGLVQGLWSGRWGASHALEDRVARLDRVPMTIGDWRGESSSLSARMIKVAELDGYLLRRYANREGDVVTVLLVCGRPGPISVHTPDVCYGGIGYEPVTSKPPRCPIDGGGAGFRDAFWALDMVKTTGVSVDDHLRIFYAWTADGDWKAVDNPRDDFADAAALCKMYIIRNTTGADGRIEADPIARFAAEFLPVLRRTLFATPGAEGPRADRPTLARSS